MVRDPVMGQSAIMGQGALTVEFANSTVLKFYPKREQKIRDFS
jgi:hypothetical protein